MEVQLMEYHIDIGSLNSFFLAGHEESINPNMCKEVIINADLHLVGLRSIFSLKDLCNKYLGTEKTVMCFEENLLTHAYTSWIAKCILTCSQINRLSQMKLKIGEEKLKWVISEVKNLRDVAERLIHSGMAGLRQDIPATSSILLSNQNKPAPTQDYEDLRDDCLFTNQSHDE